MANTPLIEISVNECFPLLSDMYNALKQDPYLTPDPISAWPNGVNEFASYVSGAIELTSGGDFWTKPDAVSFQKSNCNLPFSQLIKEKTADLESEYVTGMTALIYPCAASEWTHMFDYEFHAACPYKWKDKKIWHCMGRRNEDGNLQFAFMHTLPNDNGCTSYSLGDGECNFINKDIDGLSLMLGDKDTARSFMLDAQGKLKKSVNPILLGVISNSQPVSCIENANRYLTGVTSVSSDGRITKIPSAIAQAFADGSNNGYTWATWDEMVKVANPAVQLISTTTMLGFIYTIWGTIIKNVLYMVALKLPIPGTGSYLAKGTYMGDPYWYRLQTASGDNYLDYNEALGQATPAITAADLCSLSDTDRTPTYAALRDLELIDLDYAEDIDDTGQAWFLPVTYEKFNVEKFLEAYGSDEDSDIEISLATTGVHASYSDGLKLNWQGDILMETTLIGDAGYITCKTQERDEASFFEDEYAALALSYYSSKAVKYHTCVSDPTPIVEEPGQINMLLFTYSGLFTVGDAEGELNRNVTAGGAVTGVAYLYTGTTQPDYIEGGFFKKPSIRCLMGANEFCCGSADCSGAYADGNLDIQQCGGPFSTYKIGNPKAICDEYYFHCDGTFRYCLSFNNAADQISAKWDQVGLSKEKPACDLDPATQPNLSAPLHYYAGSRPVLAGGSIMGGVDYICAEVKKIGTAYKIQFKQGQAYNGWSAFYARIDRDLTGVVVSEYDSTLRGSLELAPASNEALDYNDFAYTPPEPPTFDWSTAIIGFAPNMEVSGPYGSGEPGVRVYVHSVDRCNFPEVYKIVVESSKMYQLYGHVDLDRKLHADLTSYGFSRGVGKDSVPSRPYYNAITLGEGLYDPTAITDSIGTTIGFDNTITENIYGVQSAYTPWEADMMPLVKSRVSQIRILSWKIDDGTDGTDRLYEDQIFYVSAKPNTFKGACDCIAIRKVETPDPNRPPVTIKLPLSQDPNQYIDVKSRCWFYLHLHTPNFIHRMHGYVHQVLSETRAKRMGMTYIATWNTPISWEVVGSIHPDDDLEGGWITTDENGKMYYNIHHTATPVYLTAMVNWSNRALKKTGFELWMYDEDTRDDVLAIMDAGYNGSAEAMGVPAFTVPPVFEEESIEDWELPDIGTIELPEININ